MGKYSQSSLKSQLLNFRAIIDHAQQHCLLHSSRLLFPSAPYKLVHFPWPTPTGINDDVVLSQLHNQGTAVLIANVGRGEEHTLQSSLSSSSLCCWSSASSFWLWWQAWSCGWWFRHQLCCSTPLHGLQNLAHLNKLVHHLNLGLVREYHSGGTPPWVLYHAASRRKVSSKLSCVGKCTCYVLANCTQTRYEQYFLGPNCTTCTTPRPWNLYGSSDLQIILK